MKWLLACFPVAFATALRVAYGDNCSSTYL